MDELDLKIADLDSKISKIDLNSNRLMPLKHKLIKQSTMNQVLINLNSIIITMLIFKPCL